MGCEGLGPTVAGRVDPIDAVLSAELAGAEAPDGLISPEAAAAGPLASQRDKVIVCDSCGMWRDWTKPISSRSKM